MFSKVVLIKRCSKFSVAKPKALGAHPVRTSHALFRQLSEVRPLVFPFP